MKSKFLEDFKKFAMRGNVVDMAVGLSLIHISEPTRP